VQVPVQSASAAHNCPSFVVPSFWQWTVVLPGAWLPDEPPEVPA